MLGARRPRRLIIRATFTALQFTDSTEHAEVIIPKER